MKKLLICTLIPFALSASEGGGGIPLLVKDLSRTFALSASEGGHGSYTYFSFGLENIDYSETLTLSDGSHAASSAQGSSPVYISGGLIKINGLYDFSMDISSTLLPSQLDERWKIDGALAQQNQFDAMISSMQFLGHYKLSDSHRLVAGPTYKLNSYKRYTFKDADGNYLAQEDPSTHLPTNVKYGLIQERVATLYATGGYWYESIPHATPNQIRLKGNLLVGLPIWNEASNTEFENVTFNSPRGYQLEANGYIGYPIMKGLEIGAFIGYSQQKKSGTDVASDGHTKWPENTLKVWQGGISAVWNFQQ